MKRFVGWGSLLAFLGVALGAFGSHGLRDQLTPERLAVFETGVRYQLIHALGLVLIGFASERLKDRKRVIAAGWLLLAGVLLFSGSLYALVLSDTPALGAITPIGGVAFLAGWGCLAWAAWKEPKASS
ncbi:DUF423 domain-containing protein [Gorillibacterium sp. CAU 1737]|uniref:DUF423 domain-containing protein n=1 Tax=Gorillibacterium sp. CAU 1737 TaxID=3140362 RepID=UPI003261B06C